MITIDQLLESVDYKIELKWVAKDKDGTICIFGGDKPEIVPHADFWAREEPCVAIHHIKLAEFENKDWQECIYEVPRKVNYGKLVGKLCRFYDKTTDRRTYGLLAYRANGVFAVCGISDTFDCCEPVRPDDDVIYKDVINELKGAKNE